MDGHLISERLSAANGQPRHDEPKRSSRAV